MEDFGNDVIFENEMLIIVRSKNLICSCAFFLYAFITSGVLFSFHTRESLVYYALSFLFSMAVQFLVIPKISRGTTRSISEKLVKNKKGEFTVEQRSEFVKELLQYPLYISFQTVCAFGISVIVPMGVLFLKLHVTRSCLVFFTVSCIMGLYSAGMRSFCLVESLCSREASLLIREGVSSVKIHRDKCYGLSFRMKIVIFCVIPFILASLTFLAHANMLFADNWTKCESYVSLFVLMLMNLVILAYLNFYMQSGICKSSRSINRALEKIISSNFFDEDYVHGKSKEFYIPTDLASELSYSIYLINGLMKYLQDISLDAITTGDNILNSSKRLTVLSDETASISMRESIAINECLETMESSKLQHLKSFDDISEILKRSDATSDNANFGLKLVADGMGKIQEITEANSETLSGIKSLNCKIDDVWSVISAIDSIAEQTKTIAFNAEIGASEAGEAGEKFHIVSNEILRLADTITTSTKEIKSKLTSIQHDCDNLIISNEADAQKIKGGSEFYSSLKSNFEELCLSTEVISDSFKNVIDMSEVQKNAFEQITATISEIGRGFEKFAYAARDINTEAQVLEKSADSFGFKKRRGAK